jgi:hypothetical protein
MYDAPYVSGLTDYHSGYSLRTLLVIRTLCYLICMYNVDQTIRTPYVICYLYELCDIE